MVIRQLIIGPIELLAAAAIIYFCLPAEGNPGFITVVGVFVASFSMAILSHAPGGLGVLEYVFLTGLDDMDQAQVLAALIVFRLLYLLLPVRRGAGHRARLRTVASFGGPRGSASLPPRSATCRPERSDVPRA